MRKRRGSFFSVVKVFLGVAAGLFALAQAFNLLLIWASIGSRSGDSPTTGGRLVGSVLGLLIGGLVCVLLLASAFRYRKGATGRTRRRDMTWQPPPADDPPPDAGRSAPELPGGR